MQMARLREAVRARPFRPFTIGLTDGRKFKIPHPEFVAMAKRIVVVINEQTDAIAWVEPGLILTLDFLEGAPTPSDDTPERDSSD